MRITLYLIVITILLNTGCTGPIRPTAISTNVQSKQPEPHNPIIRGQIIGLSDNNLVTIHVNTIDGREALYYSQKGNGNWEIVVTNASGLDYVVTAEAAGYESSPKSYTIHLSETKVYVVEAGKITENEAVHLDFQFTSIISPSY